MVFVLQESPWWSQCRSTSRERKGVYFGNKPCIFPRPKKASSPPLKQLRLLFLLVALHNWTLRPQIRVYIHERGALFLPYTCPVAEIEGQSPFLDYASVYLGLRCPGQCFCMTHEFSHIFCILGTFLCGTLTQRLG